MIHTTPKNRSGLCHLITDFHSIRQSRVARFDFAGAAFAGGMLMLLVQVARLFLSN
jgi:hypothetical protein